MSVVGADEKQQYGNGEQKLLCWRVLVTTVDLLPHIEIVVCTSVELKGHTPDPVEHEKGAGHVGDVCQTP